MNHPRTSLLLMGSPSRSNDSGSLLTRDPLPLAISLATAVTLWEDADSSTLLSALVVVEAKKAGAPQRLAVTRAVATAFWTCCCQGDVVARRDVGVVDSCDDDDDTDLCCCGRSCCGAKAVILASLLHTATSKAARDNSMVRMMLMGRGRKGSTFFGDKWGERRAS